MSAGKSFDGRILYRPGFYAKREYLNDGFEIGQTGNILYFIGESEDGIPYNATDYDATALPVSSKVNYIRKYSDADGKLYSGTLYDASKFAMTPMLDSAFVAAPEIKCIDVQTKTRATSTVQGSSVDVINLYSVGWGRRQNKLAKKISAGTTVGKKIEFKFEDQSLSDDNITSQDLTVEYTGNASTATITINNSGITTTLAGDQTDSSADLSILFTEYETMLDVVNYIEAQTGYTASLLGDPERQSSYLDAVTAQDITSTYTVKSELQAIIDYFNDALGDYIYAGHTAANARNIPDNDSDYVYFTGGTNTSATNTDWANAFTMLESVNADFVVALSGDTTIQGYLKSHIEYMNTVGGSNERLGGCGSTTGDAQATILTNIKLLNSSSISYFATRIKRRNKFNILTTYGGYYGIAMIFSAMAGNGITFPLALKELNIEGTTDNYSDDDINDMIKGSAMIVALGDTGNYEIQRGLTTYQGSKALLQSIEGMRLSLYVAKDSRTRLKTIQRGLTRMLDTTVKKQLDSELQDTILVEYEQKGYITSDPTVGVPAVQNFSSSILGNTYNYSFLATIPLPLEFGLGTYQYRVVGSV